MSPSISNSPSTSQIPLMNSNNPPSAQYVTKNQNVSITITKLADHIVVRDQDDIDDTANEVAEKIKEVIDNM